MMDPLTGYLIIFSIGFMLRGAVQHASAERQRSRDQHLRKAEQEALPKRITPATKNKLRRQHRIGWWTSEVRHGFPVHRTGIHTGWLAHKAAVLQTKAQREIARTQHLESEASFASALKQQRRMQAAIHAEIEEALATSPVQQDGSARAVREAVGDGVVLPFRKRPAPEPAPGPFGRAEKRDADGSTCPACGKPETGADPLVVASDGYRVHRSHTINPADGYYQGRQYGEPLTWDPERRPTVAAADLLVGEATIHPGGACRCDKPGAPWTVIGKETGEHGTDLHLRHGCGKESVALCSNDCAMPVSQASGPGDSDWLRRGDPRCEACDGRGTNPDRTDACPVCRGWGRADPDPATMTPAPDGAACTACGQPGTPGDPVLTDPAGQAIHRSHIAEAHERYQTAMNDYSVNRPATRGAPPMSDTTYHSVLTSCKAAVAQSDQDTSTIRGRKDAAYRLADEMIAANVDPAVVSAQMSYADSLAEAEKHLAAAGEHATSTSSTAQRYHGGVQEAVDSAPGRIAERSFHEGG